VAVKTLTDRKGYLAIARALVKLLHLGDPPAGEPPLLFHSYVPGIMGGVPLSTVDVRFMLRGDTTPDHFKVGGEWIRHVFVPKMGNVDLWYEYGPQNNAPPASMRLRREARDLAEKEWAAKRQLAAKRRVEATKRCGHGDPGHSADVFKYTVTGGCR
jgi:hypothetical protein